MCKSSANINPTNSNINSLAALTGSVPGAYVVTIPKWVPVFGE